MRNSASLLDIKGGGIIYFVLVAPPTLCQFADVAIRSLASLDKSFAFSSNHAFIRAFGWPLPEEAFTACHAFIAKCNSEG